jgi:hypothetical protein
MENDRRHDRQMVYEIEVEGVLDAEWSDWLGGLEITPQAGGNTLLVGPLRDEAALHGLLNKIRDLGLPLLSLERNDAQR